MQGLADGYFVLPYTIGVFLSKEIRTPKISNDLPEFHAAEKDVQARIQQLLEINGTRTVESYHRELGVEIMWEYCGMSRNAEGLRLARQKVQDLRRDFWKNVYVPHTDKTGEEYNPELEKALRVADFFELAELMIVDALDREESCGGHFREEHRTPEGEAKRNDADYTYVAAWEFTGVESDPQLHKEELIFDNVELKTRSYK